MAKARGARCVIGLDAVASRLHVAKKFGADHVIDIARVPAQAAVDEVRALCRPDGADAVIEVCGVPDVIPQGLQMLRTGGRYVLGGLVNPGANVTIDANILLRAVLGRRVRVLLEMYEDVANFYSPTSAFRTPVTMSRRSSKSVA